MLYSDLKNLPTLDVSHNSKIKKQLLIGYDGVDGLAQFAQAIFPSGECVAAHSHDDMAEIFYVLSGKGEIVVEGENRLLAPGICICVEKGEKHALNNSGADDLVLIYFGLVSPE